MYPIPPGEHLVENKTCKKCTAVFPITDKDMEFYTKVSPTFGGKKYVIPPPTLCPDCRQQRRLAFRNERKLYKRTCDVTGKEIISIYSPDKPYTVYHQDYWWSDKWDPMSYGKDFDFSRGAFEQFGEMMNMIPRPSLLNTSLENSEYVNYSSYLKNCYLVFDTTQGENLMFWNNTEYTNNSVDFQDARQCSECYDIIDCSDCHNIIHGWWCVFSHDCQYVVDTKNAHHCFLSDTIYNKSYIFENQQCTPDEYEKKVDSFLKLNTEERKKKIENWIQRYTTNKIYPYHLSVTFENSTGSWLLNVKNATACYSTQDSEDIKYCTNAAHLKECYDIWSIWVWAELSYEVNAALWMFKVCFWFWTWWEELYYNDHVSFSDHCFLCIWLRNKSYCILNKQYTKEEYEELVPRIIEKMMADEEWGEFFPANMSPFGYNETVASEYFPLKKEEAIKDGIFNWTDYEAPFPRVEKIIPAEKLPDDISKIPDDILNWAIECEVSKKPFRIIKQELDFYRKHNLPIPRRHPDVRHMDRMKMRNPRKLYERLCDCEKCEENWKRKKTDTVTDTECGESFILNPNTGKRARKIITTYSPDRKEIVYCEVCYEREVVG